MVDCSERAMEKTRLDMKLAQGLSSRIKTQGLGFVAVLACFLLPCIFLTILKPTWDEFSILNSQPLITGGLRIEMVKEEICNPYQSATESRMLPLALNLERDQEAESRSSSTASETAKEGNNVTIDREPSHLQLKDTESKKNASDNGAPASATNPLCDFSQLRSDTCSFHGDIRVIGLTSSIILASSIAPLRETSTWKIRPYARKWEPPLMERIKEVTLSSSASPEFAPRCTVNHTAPAIVFSTGGFLGNFFHDFTDVLVPLFITSRRYQGEVHFLITDFNSQWIAKYQPILRKLTRYGIINLDGDTEVHCFPQAQLGLFSHKELGMDPSKNPSGYSMTDFREVLSSSFSLKRSSIIGSFKRGKRPRLLIVLRKGSRSIINRREVVAMARSLGFKVVAAAPEETGNLTRFAGIVNSCDVMIGVHGAGLANMVFLPVGAAVVQIVPWGGLSWACRHDFGDPAPDMGLKYLEYEIREEESTLIQQYPRDHPVFTDPLSIHKQGWNVLWSVFLDRQKVRLDVHRFRNVLAEALQAIH